MTARGIRDRLHSWQGGGWDEEKEGAVVPRARENALLFDGR